MVVGTALPGTGCNIWSEKPKHKNSRLKLLMDKLTHAIICVKIAETQYVIFTLPR